MPTCTLKHIDDNGRALATIATVLAPITLTEVATNVTAGTENQITVASTAGVYPGMPISCPNIPPGSFVHAVRSATVLDLWCSVYNLTTGVASTSAANANATAAATGLTAYAYGFCSRTIVAAAYFEGAWRNVHNFASNIGATFGSLAPTLTEGSANYATAGFGPGMAVLPTAGTLTSGVLQATAVEYIKSDHLFASASQLKRHNGEVWGYHIITHTGGFQSKIIARPKHDIIVSAIT